MASGGPESAELDQLLNKLEQNLAKSILSQKQLEETIGRVKVIGRDVNVSGPIFTERGIKVLSRCAFEQRRSASSQEALRCLANAFLLNEPSRQIFVDLGFAPRVAEQLKIDNRDDEFVASRILFLLTYNTTANFETLVNENQLADSINQNVARHAKAFATKSARKKSDASPMVDMSLAEGLKLMFNITYFYPDLVQKFTPSIEPLVNLIINHPLPNPPLQSPITYMLNALLNLDLAGTEKKTPLGPQARSTPLFPHSKPEALVERLTTIFNKAMIHQSEKELDQAAAPLCTLIRRLYALAFPQIKEWMQMVMLPRDCDREAPLGQGDTMASRLLRFSCSPNLPGLRENISNLLFEISDSDANKFVKNIGYGFAAGFLMSHNIEIPASAAEASSSVAIDKSSGQQSAGINPITGQKLSAEARDAAQHPKKEMSDEEREREAERLFVLFERLKATGVVDVVNPVQQAVDEGRFEELE